MTDLAAQLAAVTAERDRALAHLEEVTRKNQELLTSLALVIAEKGDALMERDRLAKALEAATRWPRALIALPYQNDLLR